MCSKICFITAIYGNYEASCKKYIEQTVPTDFICFTDNPNIVSNGWKIDTTPYHYENKNEQDNGTYVNSLSNNKHTFNVAKYYKQSFQLIPILKKYDVIVWLDGSVEIIYDKTSEYILNNIHKNKIITWHHEMRCGHLYYEARDSSRMDRYNKSIYLGQVQPIQDVIKQYEYYVSDGYTPNFFKQINPTSVHFGVWLTCFVAFDNKDDEIKNFLDLWYLQTLKFSTQDQVSFPYVCMKTHIVPLTLPNEDITGDRPHEGTMMFNKHEHGK